MELSKLFLISLLALSSYISAQPPNILLVIADDLGVDYSNGYHEGNLVPSTPTLDNLRATGLTFENVFAAPKCTPSRACIMSGKYGIKTNVLGTPGHLDTSHISIFKAIENQTNAQYADAVIGKWHISQPVDPFHPNDHGADYYAGILSSGVNDYFIWEKTENGETTTESSYVTSTFTDEAINWVNAQTQPWFLWLAHVAPHTPIHTPPDSLYSIGNTGSNRRKYVAMIESIDHELGRLLDDIPTDVLDNTIIIYLGDNGTPGQFLQDYPSGQGKATLYQGGIRVPLIVSGAGVNRIGERESALVHITDIYATLLEIVGADLPGGIYNSLSLKHLLDPSASGNTRDYNYSELEEGGVYGFTIREERYKLIASVDNSTQEFYDLLLDSLETTDLLATGLNDIQQAIKADLEQEALQIRTAWSCRDHIQNGDEEDIDCGGTHCAGCSTTSINSLKKDDGIKIFPNPVKDELQIIFPMDNYSIRVIDAFGNFRLQSTTTGGQYFLNLSSLPSGIYSLQLVNLKAHRIKTKKIIKH